MRRFLFRLARLFPVFGLMLNKVRYPNLHMGPGVELTGAFDHGSNVALGEGTRFEFSSGSRVRLDEGIRLSRRVHLVAGSTDKLYIGKQTTIQDDCRIYGEVRLGAYCVLAPNIFISSGTHVFDAEPYLPIFEQERKHIVAQRSIVIGEDCWLGINVAIMPGVTVGRGCVIGANSVVTSDLPPYTVAGGLPARRIKTRLDFSPPSHIEASQDSHRPYFYQGFDLFERDRTLRVAAGREFVLALSSPDAKVLALSLKSVSANGAVTFGDETRAVGLHDKVIEFSLAPEQCRAGFFAVFTSIDIICSWAKLA